MQKVLSYSPSAILARPAMALNNSISTAPMLNRNIVATTRLPPSRTPNFLNFRRHSGVCS
jgi:hypothetical protein